MAHRADLLRLASEIQALEKVAYEPPFHKAAEADEAIVKAYNDLVSLKLGFDSFAEIPSSAMPLYQEIGKAISACVETRRLTTQVREMVRRKRY